MTEQVIPSVDANEGTPPPADNPTPPAPPADGATPPADANPFHEGLDDMQIGYLQNKGINSVSELQTELRNLEKHKGLDKDNMVELPKEGDEESMKTFRSKIGVPEKAEDYELGKPPEGIEVNEDLNSWFKKTAHEAGIPQEAASKLHDSWNNFVKEAETQAHQNDILKSEQDLSDFKKQEGQRFEESKELASRVVRNYGISDKQMDSIEGAIGTAEFIKLFANIGRGSKEDSFITGKSDNGNFSMTPEQATLKRQELIGDPKWAAAYTKGDPNKKLEMNHLNKIIAGVR